MIHLSRLVLNARSREVQRDAANCHQLHRTVLAAFPQTDGEDARDRFGILYRLDELRGRLTLLVQSEERPDWTHLPAGYLVPCSGNPACKEVARAYEAISAGQRLVFRLRANPTKRLANPNRGEGVGKRVNLLKQEDQLEWLQRKAARGGFSLCQVRTDVGAPVVPNVRVQPGGVVRGDTSNQSFRPAAASTTGRRNGHKLTFGSVLFDGELRVTDADTFRQTLIEGIGSGKAYGFGLLSIAPARAV